MAQAEPTDKCALTSRTIQRRIHAAHESLANGESVQGNVRSIVQDSWLRSLAQLPNPELILAPLFFGESDLESYRQGHPLATIMPVIRKLLVRPSQDSGLLVAVGDENGRLLWVDGDLALKRKAEGMMFVEGADWSELAVGTSAPGTALALGQGIQIAGAEHFSSRVHPWSCTAVPLHDPDSGTVLGVVDITGDEEAVAPHTLSLVQATVAAAEAQLSVHRLKNRTTKTRKASRSLYRDSLQILGRDTGELHAGGSSVSLSARHAELLTLLALHPNGLTAEELAVMAYPEDVSVTTVRAEMLRLRRLLARHTPQLVPESRPYRLPAELVVDASQVISYLQRGAHRLALNIYRGEVLPRSEAPSIVRLRQEVSAVLREAVLSDGSPDTLLKFLQLPEAENDVGAWRDALRLLPARSPRRAVVVAHIERLEAELSA
ncbi:transcriptional regulator of acetoin/glycerol metabolism [Arthrobacter pigmenti]|uniref:Transcriptional regulator of acetoin/glycerol metabolism n=1 Tax=Arthrobacter pigmenti TaxID=271432 RepID=A0A846RNV9_9MICC|nr:GAF domain-containing protein [Arthrobacter pigmenti]NJC23270.1 transcriptional regulator of acetoin/glycerol metabolism [Arthrobacter pigmenti]